MEYHIFAGTQHGGHDVVCARGVFEFYVGRVRSLGEAYKVIVRKFPKGQLWGEALAEYPDGLRLIARMNTTIEPDRERGYGVIMVNQWEFEGASESPEQMVKFSGPVQEFPAP